MSQGLDNCTSPYVYRVLRPNETLNQDLKCSDANSDMTIDQFIETGLKLPSKFISTTTSKKCARRWMWRADTFTSKQYGNKRSIIVKININLIKNKYKNLANSAYDLTEKKNREHFLKNLKQKKFAIAYKEIVFQNMIPSEAISLVYKKGSSVPSSNSSEPHNIHQVLI